MNGVDAVVLLGMLGSALAAWRRGMAQEMFHAVVYSLLIGAGLLYLTLWPLPETAQAAGAYLLDFIYYLLIAYIVAWAMTAYGAPLWLGGNPPGWPSRAMAVLLSLTKIVATLLTLNLYLAMHSLDAHPPRRRVLPQPLQESALVRLSDRQTDKVYRWLAAQGLVSYIKYTERPSDTAGKKPDALEQLLVR